MNFVEPTTKCFSHIALGFSLVLLDYNNPVYNSRMSQAISLLHNWNSTN